VALDAALAWNKDAFTAGFTLCAGMPTDEVRKAALELFLLREDDLALFSDVNSTFQIVRFGPACLAEEGRS
jgi:hypothetical protein